MIDFSICQWFGAPFKSAILFEVIYMARKGYTQLGILLPSEQYNSFKKICENNQVSMAEVIKTFIDVYLNGEIEFKKKMVYHINNLQHNDE